MRAIDPNTHPWTAKQLAFCDELIEVFQSGLSWDLKYDIIFKKYSEWDVPLKWHDHDTSYEADITAFMDAIFEFKRQLLRGKTE